MTWPWSERYRVCMNNAAYTLRATRFPANNRQIAAFDSGSYHPIDISCERQKGIARLRKKILDLYIVQP